MAPVTFFLSECPGLQTSVLGGDTIGNTTTATIFGSSYTWGASSLSVVGRQMRLRASGVYSLTGTAGQTMSMEVLIGTTSLLTTGSVLLGNSGASNKGWRLDAEAACRTAGTAGTLEAQGLALFGSTGQQVDFGFMPSTGTVQVDLTQALPASLRWTWGATGNTATMRLMTQEIMGTS